jgi:myo-inositol catabolism protein IolS
VIYNRLDRRPEQVYFPLSQRDRLGILARVPLASGLLSGKYAASATFQSNDVRSTFDRDRMRQQLAEVDQIRAVEVPPGVPMSQWALAWCLQNPAVTAVIPGCKDAAQVRANAISASLISS